MTGLALLVALAAPAAEAPPSSLLAALEEETARAMAELRSEGLEPPYYASASVSERTVVLVEAAGGALLAPQESRQRWLRVTVRVGSHELDNSGFADRGGRGAGEVVTAFPLDDDPFAMRHRLWLAFDEAYKEAGAVYAAKTAFLKTRGEEVKERFGDFTREEPRRAREPLPGIAADRAALPGLAARLSRAIAGPQAPGARLRLYLVERRFHLVDSERSQLETGGSFAALEATAWDEAEDGMPVRDLVLRYGARLADLGPPADLEAALAAMVASVRAQATAPVLAESYHGPVLFEDAASAQLLGTVLLPRLEEPREPISPGGGGGSGAAGEWATRVGSRVLSPALTVVDDPTLVARGGVPLVGVMTWDMEGVRARPVTLIDKGILKDFVGSRWPRKGYATSNGHARRSGGAAWALGVEALPSNLVVTAEGGADRAAVRARLVEELAARGLDSGIVIRRLDDNSIFQLGATDWLETGEHLGRVHESSALEMPVAIFRLTPDGKEERLRGARFGNVPPEALRSLLAASAPGSGEAVYNFVLTFDLSYATAGPLSSAYVPLSMVAPGAVLLEEAELKPIPGPFPRRPLAAARRRAGR